MSEAMENGHSKPARPRGSTRRRMIRRGITTVAAATGTTAALRPILAARQTDPTAAAPQAARQAAPGAPAATESGADVTAALFDEVYRGRRLQGFTSTAAGSGVDILIDGSPLHVMRRVDGSYISLANHYQPYTTVLGTARGAVDVIGRAALSANAAEHHHH